ncbi:MAG: DUF4340 domain-containing protein [Oscillospiraceae bacterium]|nr:DUF4340 domain-containing protein [Oscillospiraceae bacterium]
MSKSLKSLLIGIGVLVVLGGAIAALKLTEPGSGKESSDSSSVSSQTVQEDSLSLFNFDYNDIDTITVDNSNGGYTIKRTHRGEDQTAVSQTSDTADSESDTEDKTTFTVDGLESFKLNDSVIATLPANLASQNAVKVIEENSQDTAQYGLDKPQATAVIKTDGASEGSVTISIGDETPTSGNVYVMLDNNKKIYSVSNSVLNLLTYGREYFISLTLIEKPASEDDYPIIENLSVSRPDLENDIVLQYDEKSADSSQKGGTAATHVMVSPVEAYLDVSKSTSYTHGLFGLTASSVLSLSPTQEELDFAGINEPLCTVTMQLENGGSKTFRIGKEFTTGSSKSYAGYMEGTNVLYQFSADSVPWLTMKPEDIMSSIIFGSYIYDIRSLTVKDDNKTLAFEGNGTSADDYKVTLNGKEFDFSRFRDFYQALIAAPAESIELSDEGAGKLLVSVIMTEDNGTQTQVDFYEAENRNVLIKKNGKACFKARASFVNKSLIPNIDLAEGTDKFITTW